MRRCASLAALGTGLFILTAACSPAEQAKDAAAVNPAYRNWSLFKVGASATLKMVVVDKTGDDPNIIDATARPDAPSERVTAYKLLQSSPEKVVVEMIQTEIDPLGETEHAPVKITYPAKVEKKYVDQTLPKEKVSNFKEGKDVVEAMGKKIECNWAESEITVGGESSYSKLWWADSIPGGTIKQTTIKKQGGKVFYETTTTLTNYSTGK